MKPLIGIIGCIKPFGIFNMPNHAASDTYVRAVDQVVGGVPLIVPANGEAADIDTLVSRLDGLLFTGSRSNVAPEHYGGAPLPEDLPLDPARDGVTLPLLRAAIRNGVPVLAICRGLQELNVALGGTLHAKLQDAPERLDHATPLQPLAGIRTGRAHLVHVTPGGWLHRLAGAREIWVNSLHNQGIDRLAPGLFVEATASDGVIEAVRVIKTPEGRPAGYAVGVQWHPEYDFETNPLSARIFADFGAAVLARAHGARLSATG
jgi:putative glutamine amidotransferase